MEKKVISYEIFADCVYGSDVVNADTFNEARKIAEEWAKYSNCPVIVMKIEKQIVLKIEGEKNESDTL